MFPLLAIFLYGKDDSRCNRTVSIGGAYYKKNIFWSQPVPGIHYSSNGEFGVIYNGIFEKRAMVFDMRNSKNTTFAILMPNISEIDFQQFQVLYKKKPEIRIYVDGVKRSIPLFSHQFGGMFISSSYKIIINEEINDCQKFYFQVISTNDTQLSIGRDLIYHFELSYSNVEKSRPLNKVNNHQSWVFVIVIVALFIITLTFCFLKIRKYSGLSINEVWRIPTDISNTMTISTFGLFVFVLLTIVAFTSWKTNNGIFSFVQATYPSIIVANSVLVFWSTFLSRYLNFYDYIISSLFFLALFIIPAQIIGLITSIFYGSLNGSGLIRSIVSDFIYVVAHIIVTRGTSETVKLLKLKRTIEVSKGDPLLPSSPTFFERFLNLLNICTTTYICMSVCNEIMLYLIEGYQIDMIVIGSSILLMIITNSIFSIIRTTMRVGRSSISWMSGYIKQNIPILIAQMVSWVYYWNKYRNEGLESTLFILHIILCNSVIVFSLSVFAAYFSSFVFIYLSIVQDKVT